MASKTLRGALIVLEGPDGVGKSTIHSALSTELTRTGHDVLSLAVPGREPGSIGELIYRIHHDDGALGVGDIASLARQALDVAAHIDAIERLIGPALKANRTVLVDRFWWSTWVYGVVAGCHRRPLRGLIDAERAANQDESMLYWQRISLEYGRLAAREKKEYPVSVIDNVGTPESALAVVKNALGLERDSSAVAMKGVRSVVGRSESHILPLKPSVVYDTYWKFAAERQEVFFRRLAGGGGPWTSDPVLSDYKFTNAYRASDRVSQFLIRHVIYDETRPTDPNEIFFRIMLFKIFNKIETWTALENAFGPLSHEEYSFQHYDRVLSRAMSTGSAIYSAAYIMPSGGRELQHARKHQNHLALLERMIAEDLPMRLADCKSMQRAFTLLKSYPTIGDFLGYQYVTDINYSELTNFSEMDFVVPGPGALDGIRKCFLDRGGLNEPEIIKFMAERQEREFERLGLTFRSLWGRRLQLIDCQNLFCEVDKYSRVAHPEVEGLSGRIRIKQKFEPKSTYLEPWYPPKWGLNEAIQNWTREHPAQPTALF
jgi:GTPase SAR1 family protein